MIFSSLKIRSILINVSFAVPTKPAKSSWFNQQLYEIVLAKELMHKPTAKIKYSDDIFQGIKKFEESGQ